MNETPVLDPPSLEYDQAQLLRSQRLESVGALAGGIAHDLNNILTPILLSIALLDEQIEDADSRRLLGVLEDSARRGATMVRQIQAFSRGLVRPVASIDLRSLSSKICVISSPAPSRVRSSWSSKSRRA